MEQSLRTGIEMVISHFNEDLSFIASLPWSELDAIYVYTKTDDIRNLVFPAGVPNVIVIPLPNVGRCDHTYLYHIIKRYDNLAAVTIFLPGSCTLPEKLPQMQYTMHMAIKERDSIFFAICPSGPGVDYRKELKNFQLDEWKSTHKDNDRNHPEAKLEPCVIRPFGDWYKQTIGNEPLSFLVLRGIFAVSKEHVHNRPIEFYQKLIGFVSAHSNPEAGHYIERSWSTVFMPYPKSRVKQVDAMHRPFLLHNTYLQTGFIRVMPSSAAV